MNKDIRNIISSLRMANSGAKVESLNRKNSTLKAKYAMRVERNTKNKRRKMCHT